MLPTPLGLDHCIFLIKSQGKPTGDEEDAYRLPVTMLPY